METRQQPAFGAVQHIMKIILAGGSGQVGQAYAAHRRLAGDDVLILSRSPRPGELHWDGVHQGAWVAALEGADVVVNLAGRTVDCRYTKTHLTEMLASRVDSTEAIGAAIAACSRPPRVWLQMSTATIYAHRVDAPNDERDGVLGGHEPGAPVYWRGSVEIAKAWERAAADAPTPETRKVILRSAMVMGRGQGGVFDTLLGLTRVGLGGRIGSGEQFVSFIHEHDFCRALDFLIGRADLDGVFNLASPSPLPQRDFAAGLRRANGTTIALPAAEWMVHLGAFLLRTDPELVLKSRRVVPGRLEAEGFEFAYPEWEAAAVDLVRRVRARRRAQARPDAAQHDVPQHDVPGASGYNHSSPCPGSPK